MKKLIKVIAALSLVLAMLISSLIIVAAEVPEAPQGSDDDTSVVIITDDGGRAYELVWKFKAGNGHFWKRRWNATLGEWYDPEWILVY